MAGAGFKTFNTGDVLTASDVNTYLMQQTVMVFASSAARSTALGANVAEGMLSYLKDTDVVEVYNGSAWVSSDDPNAIQNTIVDAKGDLITATAADTPARLAVGTDGYFLTADSTTSTGLKWAAAASSGGMTLIQETTASANTAIDFNSISGSYTDLVLLWHGLYMSATGSYYGIRANSDSGSNYPNIYMSAESTSPVGMGNTGYDNTAFGSLVNNGTSTTGYQTGMGTLKLYNYASTTKTKKFEFETFYYSSNNSRYNWVRTSGFWNSTSAISSLNIFRGSGSATLSNISDSSIRLYGVK